MSTSARARRGLAAFTTQELLDELELRMQEWPNQMYAARAVIRGVVKATQESAVRVPMIAEVLGRHRDGQ